MRHQRILEDCLALIAITTAISFMILMGKILLEILTIKG